MKPHPSHENLVQLSKLKKELPRVLEYLQEWRTAELEKLPLILDRTAVAQGRCQVLDELCRLIETAPDLAAKLPAAANIAHH